MSVVSVSVLFRDKEEAERIGRQMIEERLAACVNIGGPVNSVYRWEGEIEDAQEVPASFKTTSGSVDRLIVRVAELHSYDVPSITASAIDKLFAPYADWVERECE